MFIEKAKDFNSTLKNFFPFSPNATVPDWSELDSSYSHELIRLGEKYMDYCFIAIPATAFMDFTRTGNRTDYEDIYFAKRRALNALTIAECIENNGRFIDNITNGIFSICEESAWQIPAHNSYIRDTPQLILPDSTLPVLDLFACETGAMLAMIRYLIRDTLNKISPIIVQRIENELNNRIIIPYINCHFWWMGNGDEPMCNWTIWCTQNILITAFTLNLTDEFQKTIFLKASTSVDYFLKEYGDDGCCDEGAGYYRHAGLCLFNTLEILNAITNNHFSSLYKNNKIKNIASYIINVHVHDKYYINYADCSPIAGRAGVREFLFGKRTLNSDLMKFAALDHQSDSDQLLSTEINLFYRIQAAFTEKEINNYDISGTISHDDIFYSSVGIFKAHDDTTCLAVKAGDNDDSHNHNDTGSFTIYKNGEPMFIDVGVETYCKKTFSPQRYEIWTMQSTYHNLPDVDNMMQMNGPYFKAADVFTCFESERSSISMNIAPAYPLDSFNTYKRTVTLHKNKSVLIEDIWDSVHTVVSNLMTYTQPSICSNNMIQIGTLGSALIEGASSIEIEEIPITDKRLQGAWKHSIYRIRITPSGNTLTIIMR
ncbi:MAG: heparinase II/III family protein [Lachnotalea sp.]